MLKWFRRRCRSPHLYLLTFDNKQLDIKASGSQQPPFARSLVKMIRASAILAVTLLTTSAVADTNLDIPYPYNCSTRSFCTELRTKMLGSEEIFSASYVGVEDESVVFNLTNKKGDSLVLSITGVQNQRYRVEIEEPDRHRYHLEYALEKEPVKRPFTSLDINDTYVIAMDDDENNSVKVIFSPFSIEFYKGSTLENTFDGSRLVMQNTADSQAFTFAVNFKGTKILAGLLEHVDWVNLRHTADLSIDPYRFRSTDYGAMKFDLDTTEAMYGSVPTLYSVGKQYSSGIFINNAAEMYIDIDTTASSAYVMVDGGTLDLFVLLGSSFKDTVQQYVDLTGRPHLPQLWVLGYHQCRWAYNTTEDVETTIQDFDDNKFPLDVLWLDIEYTSDRKWFTWNLDRFPDPIEMLNFVDSHGHRKIVPISDPHIKIDPYYPVYTEALANDFFIKDQNGSDPFIGECWPGNSSWIDFLNPAARDFYAAQHLYENFPSTSTLGGFWNDMNEPTLFDNLYERTAPFSTVHYGNVKHRDIHNIYGMLHTMSTHKGLMDRDNGRLRPFILSRSYFAGSQRYASKWSGDNYGDYENLRYTVPMALTANLVGVAVYGADIPGFNGKTDENLAIRWYQIGIWLPFFRAHANQDVPRREPYRFSEETQEKIRDAMALRYQHIPYWYTLFYQHVQTGDPVIRPLFYEYPDDDKAYEINDQLLLGTDILAASVYEADVKEVDVYLPGSDALWYQVTGAKNVFKAGTQTIALDMTFSPVFYRAGSIIPTKATVKRSTTEMRSDPFTLIVVPDNDGKATGIVYIDDYESFEYQESNNFLYLQLDYDASKGDAIFIKELDEKADPKGLEFIIEEVKLFNKTDKGDTYNIVSLPFAGVKK
ncbi:neutral alpha-glucosidase C-like [Cylas formicarius]|uniref:neutral alpha-glucosidase C-like n=1 Tax=Cylas formicarius TaxID=197179 RepID=UPI002958CE80|nr:neutral alpha-glucosidase C-like [Cylas formicarius]